MDSVTLAREQLSAAMLTDTAYLLRAEDTRGSYGGTYKVFRYRRAIGGAPLGFRARVNLPRATYTERGEQATALYDADISLEWAATEHYAPGDAVMVGTDVYEVIGSDKGRSQALRLVLQCRRMENPKMEARNG